MAVVAPMPKASVITAVAVNPGAFLSCPKRFLQIRHFVSRECIGAATCRLRFQVSFQIRMNQCAVSKSVAALLRPQYSTESVWLQADLNFVTHRAEYAQAGL